MFSGTISSAMMWAYENRNWIMAAASIAATSYYLGNKRGRAGGVEQRTQNAAQESLANVAKLDSENKRLEKVFFDKRTLINTLQQAIVRIEGDDVKGSGVLAKHDTYGTLLVTVDHVVTRSSQAYLGGQIIDLNSLYSFQVGSNNFYLLSEEDVFEDNIPTLLIGEELEIGEKVYFGGYPFEAPQIHLHRGHISSIQSKKFSIDGTAVPGMSGGPIAIQRDGQLYIIGTIGSETFDPIEGFSKALSKMYGDQNDMDARYENAREIQKQVVEEMRHNPAFTKIPKGHLSIRSLDDERRTNSQLFDQIWDDLNRSGVLSDDGTVNDKKLREGQLGLREEFRHYEQAVIDRLQSAIYMESGETDPSIVNLPFRYKEPTDSLNTVALSLTQSLSTGIISGNLLTELPELSSENESTSFEIGKTKRLHKKTKQIKKTAKEARATAIEAGNFQNLEIPSVLYRFVSKEDAKRIKKEGITHEGNELDEIPFLTKPSVGMALSVGAIAVDKMIAVFPDRIPGLTADNVRQVSERNGNITFRISVSIPREAIEIAEC